ncbi:TPA: hypothetical protein ACPZWZ_003828, partial [Morganella morganii]
STFNFGLLLGLKFISLFLDGELKKQPTILIYLISEVSYKVCGLLYARNGYKIFIVSRKISKTTNYIQ